MCFSCFTPVLIRPGHNLLSRNEDLSFLHRTTHTFLLQRTSVCARGHDADSLQSCFPQDEVQPSAQQCGGEDRPRLRLLSFTCTFPQPLEQKEPFRVNIAQCDGQIQKASEVSRDERKNYKLLFISVILFGCGSDATVLFRG